MKFDYESKRSKLETTAFIVFLSSLFFPTYCTNGGCPYIFDGLITTLFGWIGALFIDGAYYAWFANPLFVLALVYNKKSTYFALIVSTAALFISASFLKGGKVLLNEAGHYGYVTELKIGYWLWLTAMILAFITTLFALKAKYSGAKN